jgi:predicted small metal-binding protein
MLGVEGDPVKYVKCQCGVELWGATEDEIVEAIQVHGREAHAMEVPREQALALVQDVPGRARE